MSTIKANNYEASTAGNNLIFKTNNAERMRIDTSGNLTLSSGNLTLSSGNLTLSSGTLSVPVQRGSYGSLSVSGSKGGYSGIDFTAASATFMIRSSDGLSGVYRNDNSWMYYVDGSGNYYSGNGACPQTTLSPTADAHLTRKDYVDSIFRVGAVVNIGTNMTAVTTPQGVPSGWTVSIASNSTTGCVITIPEGQGTWLCTWIHRGSTGTIGLGYLTITSGTPGSFATSNGGLTMWLRRIS